MKLRNSASTGKIRGSQEIEDKSAPSSAKSVEYDNPVDFDLALTGKTLLVYRYLITCGRPVGPRDVQRALKLSGPSVASFHLEKLARSGLVRKSEDVDGSYLVDRVHLKHYFLLRQRLVPKYFLYATLATFFTLGWIVTLFLGGARSSSSVSSSTSSFPFSPFGGGSPADFYVFIYGITVTAIFALIFWRETLQVLKNEKI